MHQVDVVAVDARQRPRGGYRPPPSGRVVDVRRGDDDGAGFVRGFVLVVEEAERVPRRGERELHEDVEVGVPPARGVGEHRDVVDRARSRRRWHLDDVSVVTESGVVAFAQHPRPPRAQDPRVVVQLRDVRVRGPAGDVTKDAIVAEAGEDAGLVHHRPGALGRAEGDLLQRVLGLMRRVDVADPEHAASVRRGVELADDPEPAADDGRGLHEPRSDCGGCRCSDLDRLFIWSTLYLKKLDVPTRALTPSLAPSSRACSPPSRARTPPRTPREFSARP